jgi:hypothetical protein
MDGKSCLPLPARHHLPQLEVMQLTDRHCRHQVKGGTEGRGGRGASEREGIREGNSRECLYVLTVTCIYRHQVKRLPHEFLLAEKGYCCGFIIMCACPDV